MKPTEYVEAALRTEHTPSFVILGPRPHGDPTVEDRVMSRLIHGVLGKMSELGELADAIKKRLIYGKPLDEINLVEEIGDDSWYTALILDALAVGWEAAWQKNIAKLRTRFPDKFTEERALNRDLDAERAALEGLIVSTPLKPDIHTAPPPAKPGVCYTCGIEGDDVLSVHFRWKDPTAPLGGGTAVQLCRQCRGWAASVLLELVSKPLG